ncbi:MAG: hypothetical protein ACI9PP_001604, partial [Halobacteriales archaeon]
FDMSISQNEQSPSKSIDSCCRELFMPASVRQQRE